MALDPTALTFSAVDAPRKMSCRFCAFELENSSVCHAAEAEAKKRGMKSCEEVGENKKGYIYVIAPTNVRQFGMFK